MVVKELSCISCRKIGSVEIKSLSEKNMQFWGRAPKAYVVAKCLCRLCGLFFYRVFYPVCNGQKLDTGENVVRINPTLSDIYNYLGLHGKQVVGGSNPPVGSRQNSDFTGVVANEKQISKP